MKGILYLFLIVGLLVSVFVGVGYSLPASTQVNRSIAINVSQEVVFELVGDHEKSKKWSPWVAKDPQMEITYTNGTSGENATMHWVSKNPDIGAGSSTFIEYLPDEKVVMRLDFGELLDTTASITLKALGEGNTQVTWILLAEHPSIVSRYFGLVLDGLVGADFEAGLIALKRVAEETPNK